jgi:hypothetical protein
MSDHDRTTSVGLSRFQRGDDLDTPTKADPSEFPLLLGVDTMTANQDGLKLVLDQQRHFMKLANLAHKQRIPGPFASANLPHANSIAISSSASRIWRR